MHRSPYIFPGITLAFLAIMVIVQAQVFDAVLYFLFAGVIPGTGYALPPLGMFLLIIAVGWAVVARVSAIFVDERKLSQEAHKILERTQRLPRRRYQRV